MSCERARAYLCVYRSLFSVMILVFDKLPKCRAHFSIVVSLVFWLLPLLLHDCEYGAHDILTAQARDILCLTATAYTYAMHITSTTKHYTNNSINFSLGSE